MAVDLAEVGEFLLVAGSRCVGLLGEESDGLLVLVGEGSDGVGGFLAEGGEVG